MYKDLINKTSLMPVNAKNLRMSKTKELNKKLQTN